MLVYINLKDSTYDKETIRLILQYNKNNYLYYSLYFISIIIKNDILALIINYFNINDIKT